MKIQNKLSLGIGLLFGLIVLLTFVSLKYVDDLSLASQSILKANYNSMEYARQMLECLEPDSAQAPRFDALNIYLEKQKQNITESGEKEITEQLAQHLEYAWHNHTDAQSISAIRQDLNKIMNLNMAAIERKSRIAEKTGTAAKQWITAAGSISFLLGMMILLNLPSILAKPIKELLGGIKQITLKHYGVLLHLQTKDEFGQLAEAFNIMSLRLDEYDKSKMSSFLIEKKRMETLINNLHDPVIGLDQDGIVMFVNDAAVDVLNLRREQILSRDATALAFENDLLRNLLRNHNVGSDVQSTQDDRVRQMKIFSNNRESYFERVVIPISIIPIGDEHAQKIGEVIMLKNVTAYKEYELAKSNFIATVSHELKTPISSIKMSLQLLEKDESGSITDGQRQLVDSMEEDCARLLKISSELLNMSQAETGNIKLNLQSADAEHIVQYAVDSLKTIVEQRNVRVQIDKETALPSIVADAEKTAWVMINLLTNAVRYSPEHSMVTILLARRENMVEFSVKDEGNGIDPRYRDKIFERYFQVPGSSASGSGLGLAISKEFIEAQGGSIGLESTIGYGSRFWFRLPIVSRTV